MIAREWLVREISTLREEHLKAKRRRAEADIRLVHANDEYNAALEAETVLEGCLRGLRDELKSRDAGAT
jgi:hypothetical protein